IVDHAVAQGNVVSVVIDAAEATARNVEAFEDVVMGQTKFDRVRAARDHRAQPINASSSDRHLVYVRTRLSEYQIARVSRFPVDFRYVAGLKQRGYVLQFLESSGRAYLVCHCKPGAATNSDQE